MLPDYEIDKVDREILSELMQDARMSFQEIARKLIVSGGTVHVRWNKMRENGIVKGSRLTVDHKLLGYDVCAFIGINLHNARDYTMVLSKLKAMPEITEVHYTTGKYSMFVKVIAESTLGLHTFLVDRLQKIEEIQSTETFISLDIPVERGISFV